MIEAASGNDSLTILLSNALLRSSTITRSPSEVTFDYFLSMLNLAIAFFLVLNRPDDKVVRLLGFGMVGTAAAFNLQAHSVYDAFVPFGPLVIVTFLHFVYHTVSAATYLHALVIFPTGLATSRRVRIFIKVVYALAAEEMIMLVLFIGSGKTEPIPPIIIGLATVAAGVGKGLTAGSLENISRIVQADTTVFILFFGLVMPLVALAVQLRSHRTATSTIEREQRQILAWALFTISIIGTLLFSGVLAFLALSGGGFTSESLEQIENLGATIFFPVFSLIPVTLAFATLRTRLFQIEVVLSRGLVYAPLTALTAGLFAGLSAAFSSVLLAVTGQKSSELATIVAAVIAAAAFSPIRSRLQKTVDRHFKEDVGKRKEDE